MVRISRRRLAGLGRERLTSMPACVHVRVGACAARAAGVAAVAAGRVGWVAGATGSADADAVLREGRRHDFFGQFVEGADVEQLYGHIEELNKHLVRTRWVGGAGAETGGAAGGARRTLTAGDDGI